MSEETWIDNLSGEEVLVFRSGASLSRKKTNDEWEYILRLESITGTFEEVYSAIVSLAGAMNAMDNRMTQIHFKE